MKRLKYTRRFVNVQLTGGKRKVRSTQSTDDRPAYHSRAIIHIKLDFWADMI